MKRALLVSTVCALAITPLPAQKHLGVHVDSIRLEAFTQNLWRGFTRGELGATGDLHLLLWPVDGSMSEPFDLAATLGGTTSREHGRGEQQHDLHARLSGLLRLNSKFRALAGAWAWWFPAADLSPDRTAELFARLEGFEFTLLGESPLVFSVEAARDLHASRSTFASFQIQQSLSLIPLRPLGNPAGLFIELGAYASNHSRDLNFQREWDFDDLAVELMLSWDAPARDDLSGNWRLAARGGHHWRGTPGNTWRAALMVTRVR